MSHCHRNIKSVLKPLLFVVALFSFAVTALSFAQAANAASTDKPHYSAVYKEAKKHLGTSVTYL
ncbi:hypothetical protein ACFQ22_09275 [Lentilactobacillus raoultii]|uniref:Uncharacterized protein n=1 Tax=Lentilactobacillus raoultii TaxID=1987503 RepID=A0ABW3PMK9_9LACO|nr:hypothetical protein [Lentilactobacillus raoultii]